MDDAAGPYPKRPPLPPLNTRTEKHTPPIGTVEVRRFRLKSCHRSEVDFGLAPLAGCYSNGSSGRSSMVIARSIDATIWSAIGVPATAGPKPTEQMALSV